MGYDDPRFVQQAIEELQREIANLKRASLPFAVHQKGPTTGSMRAVAINDPRQAGSMWVNYSNAGPGLGPYSAVTDTAGVVRAEWGNLAVNGNSPAQYGFRASDAGGSPVFDSLGLIAVMKLAAPQFTGNDIATYANAGDVIINDGTRNWSVTFTASRTATYLALGILSGKYTQGTSGNVSFGGYVAIDGAAVTSFFFGTQFSSAPLIGFASVAAGSHTFSVHSLPMTGTSTVFLAGMSLLVFQLGA